jgi:hypothetical protein
MSRHRPDLQLAAPDWAMCGMRFSDEQVGIFASRELSEAELTYEAHVVEAHWADLFEASYYNVGHRFALTVEGDTRKRPDGQARFVLVTAPTYGEALARLLGEWQPDPEPNPQLPAGSP